MEGLQHRAARALIQAFTCVPEHLLYESAERLQVRGQCLLAFAELGEAGGFGPW